MWAYDSQLEESDYGCKDCELAHQWLAGCNESSSVTDVVAHATLDGLDEKKKRCCKGKRDVLEITSSITK